MKHYFSILCCFATMFFCISSAKAQSVEVDSITYKLYGDSVHVTSCHSDLHTANILPKVTINDVEYPVKVIGSNAFQSIGYLHKVVIPEGIVAIQSYAFHSSQSITSITLPTTLINVGYNAFGSCSEIHEIHIGSIGSWCAMKFIDNNSRPNIVGYSVNLYLNGEVLTDIEIPGSVKQIQSYAFYNCDSLKNVKIQSGVTAVDSYAFYDCSKLTSIIIPNSVTSLGQGVFYGCKSLASVNIPEGVTSIGDGAFRNCSGLTSVVIPNSVTSLGNYAFNCCI